MNISLYELISCSRKYTGTCNGEIYVGMSVYNECLFSRKFLNIILIYRYITLLTKHTYMYNGVLIRRSLSLVILNSLLIIPVNGLQLIAVHIVPYKRYKLGQITCNHDLSDINMQ